MINSTSKIENSDFFNKSVFTNADRNNDKNISLFFAKSDLAFGIKNDPPNKTIPPSRIDVFKSDNDTIRQIPETDTLRFFSDPKDMIVVEFYPKGVPHYVKSFYDNVMTKKTEYTSDGIAVAVDEYKDGVLIRHTENYPATGEIWTIEEYGKKGNVLRNYEYTPDGELLEYKAFPSEE